MFSLTKLNPEIIPEEDNKQTKSKHNDTKSSSIQKYKVSEDICVAICRKTVSLQKQGFRQGCLEHNTANTNISLVKKKQNNVRQPTTTNNHSAVKTLFQHRHETSYYML